MMNMEKSINLYMDLLMKGKSNQRKKLHTHELENSIKQRFADASQYQLAGGYTAMHQVIQGLVEQGRLKSMNNARSNGRQPALSTSYWIMPITYTSQWSAMDMLRISDRLPMDKYRENPELQSPEEWQRIERVYEFLRVRERREWVTREERSLELFGQEKWIVEEQGMLFLRRLGLTLEDLKARVYGEPFVYWPCPGVPITEARKLLVVENLSLFHTCKISIEQDRFLPELKPDVIIYGEGKKIESSLPFMKDIIRHHQVAIYYAGDIDPEGWSIYVRLCLRYPEYEIQLATPIYEEMVRLTPEPWQSVLGQYHNEAHLQYILEELRSHSSLSPNVIDIIKHCWVHQLRIPQEVLTIETIQQLKDEASI